MLLRLTAAVGVTLAVLAYAVAASGSPRSHRDAVVMLRQTGRPPGARPFVALFPETGPVIRRGAVGRLGGWKGSVLHLQLGFTRRQQQHGESDIEAGRTAVSGGAVATTRSTFTASMPTPIVAFDGLTYSDGGAAPPDPTGDVGPSEYVQAVNDAVGIFSLSGTREASFSFNALWAHAATGSPCDAGNYGDPQVLYDPIGGRWIVTDVGIGGGATLAGPYDECIAVSQTGDPVSGGWWFYAIPTGSGFPDYQKIAAWSDGIYVTANVTTGNEFAGGTWTVWALDRADLESGATLRYVSAQDPRWHSPLAATLSSASLPPSGRNEFIVDGPGVQGYDVWSFHPDFSGSGSTLTGPTGVTNNNFLYDSPLPIQTGGDTLVPVSQRVMTPVVYRDIGGVESLWVSATGSADATELPAVVWSQVDVTGGTLPSSTVAVQYGVLGNVNGDGVSRWLPSVSVDEKGDMAVGYSAANASVNPDVRYSGRLATDASGTLPLGEGTLLAGVDHGFPGTQSSGRWGDYSAMSLAPDGCTFWYTNEYWDPSNSYWKTRIGAFAFPTCTGTSPPTITDVSPTSAPAGSTITLTGTGFAGVSNVAINGTSASFTVDSTTQIRATIPTDATSGFISVTSAGGTVTSPSEFLSTPSITSFSPASATPGTAILIEGANLGDAYEVRFNGTSTRTCPNCPADFTVDSGTEISAILPAAATTGPVSVLTPGGTAVSSAPLSISATGGGGGGGGGASGGSGGGGGSSGGGGGGGGAVPPNLHLALGAMNAPTAIGDIVTYQITISDSSTAGASDAILTVQLPTGSTYAGSKVDRGPGCVANSTTVTCNLDFFPASLTDVVLVSAKIGEYGSQTVTAQVVTTPNDSDPSDNSASLAQPLAPPATPTSGSGSAGAPPKGAPAAATVCSVPNVVGKSLAAARALLHARRCGVGRITYRTASAAGRVLSQSPRPGRKLRAGSLIALVVGRPRR